MKIISLLKRARRAGRTLLGIGLLAGLPVANAATYTWTGAGFFGTQDFLWSNPNNWAGLAAPTPGEANVTIVFPNNNAPKVTTNDIVGLNVAHLQFSGSNYVVHGKPAGNVLGLQSDGLLGWSIIASRNGNSFAATSPLALHNNGIINVATNCTLTTLAPISGSGGFTKNGPGKLEFNAGTANTYSGSTTVTDGELALNNHTWFPTVTGYVSVPGPLVIGTGDTNFAPLVRLLVNDQIGNGAPVTVNGNGRLWLNGRSDTIGALTLNNAAEVSTGVNGGSASPGLLTLNGPVTCATPDPTISAIIQGRLDLGLFTRTFHVSGTLNVYASISGNSIFQPGIEKTGLGYLYLAYSTNTYSGPTLLQQGYLTLRSAATPLGIGEAGVTIAGGVMGLDNVIVAGKPLTIQSGGGAIGFYATNQWTGPVTLNGNLSLTGWASQSHRALLTISGAISGSGALEKNGDWGILRLTGFFANTFTGGLLCREGEVILSKNAPVAAVGGPVTVGLPGNAGQWSIVDVQQSEQIPNHLPITLLDRGALDVAAGVTETVGPVEIIGGLLAASGQLILAGDVTNRHSALNPGDLAGDVVLPVGTRIFHCDADSQLRVGGDLMGDGAVLKTGPGELLFNNAHTYTGLTIVSAGKLTLEETGRPGAPANGTIIEPDGLLVLNGVGITNESLVLHGGGTDNVALRYSKTNTWRGPVAVEGGAVLESEPPAHLAIIGPISGWGGWSHTGGGRLLLAGSTDNTFAGPVYFRHGELLLAKTNASAIPAILNVGSAVGSSSATVKALAPNQFAPANGAGKANNSLTLYPGTSFDANGFNQTIPNLNLHNAQTTTGAGILTLPGDLNVYPGNSSEASYLFGQVRFVTGVLDHHNIQVAPNAQLWNTATFLEFGPAQHLHKTGAGHVLNLASNSLSGTLTIHQGRWYAAHPGAFGTSDGPTIVEPGASLITFAGTFAEPLTLAGAGDGEIGALQTSATNTFTGPITLATNTLIHTDTNAILTFAGAISGPGGFTKQGAGTLQLLGSQANTYSGATIVTSGKLELAKTNAIAIPGDLTVTGPNNASQVRLLQPEQIADSSPVVLQDTGWIALDGNSETIGSLSGTGAMFQSGNQTGLLTVGGNNDSTTFHGNILGGGGLTKAGTGTFTLTGNNLYTGTTTVNAGTLLVMGQQPQSSVTLLTGGRLGGSGRVGHVSDLNGHVSPGASIGILVCSNYSTFTPANRLEIEINGATPGSGHDQLHVFGNVLLMGGTLQVTMNTGGAVGTEYVIIQNDGSDPVTGSFTGLPEGAMLTNNGAVFQITYQGGDGNDVVLQQKPIAPAAPTLQGQSLPGGSFKLTSTGQPNVSYAVEATSDLAPPITWRNIGFAVADAAGQIEFTDPDAVNFPMRFYRLNTP